ncbi:cytochrome P450 6k1 [Diachasma alloeum]|uniref:cytochrome P450 6k1 n=1 Tax=Diachasma alloeum TaxID=454923 RepID=UPI0007384241|nr:cytochrome P450 6k1 [Diachasma alloeum]
MAFSVAAVITTVCVLLGIFYIWAKWKLSYWQRRGVPTLPTSIFFGNFADSIFLRISPGYLLGQLYNQAPSDAKFLGIYIFQKPFLLLRDPHLVKQIFIKDFNVFSSRHFAVKNGRDKIGTQNLFSIDNPQWQYLRNKLSPAFSSGKLKALFGLMLESSESLKTHLENQFRIDSSGKRTIEVRDASTRYTTDIISSLAFGVRTNSFEKSTSEFYTRSRDFFSDNLFSTLVLFCLAFFPRVVEHCLPSTFLGKQTSYFKNMFNSSMQARAEAKSERGDIMDTLLKLKHDKDDGPFKFEDDTLMAQSVIFFVAGLETSATTISFALWELAKSPEIQERVRAEILEKLEGGELTYEKVQQMKYLTQVINETLRLYPPAPILDRVAEQDYRIPDTNVIIERGTPVYVALPGVHMDPEYFPNPEKFDPDRFNDEHKIEACTYMPFGEGPRTCIGTRIGSLQTAVGLIRMLHNYRFSVNPSYEARVTRRGIFIAPENGVHLYFEKLHNS